MSSVHAGIDDQAAVQARPQRVRRRRDRGVDPIRWWLSVIGALVAIYLILPTLFVIPMSFSSSSTFQFPPKDFSLQLYVNFFTKPCGSAHWVIRFWWQSLRRSWRQWWEPRRPSG